MLRRVGRCTVPVFFRNSVTSRVFIEDFYRVANRHRMAKVVFCIFPKWRLYPTLFAAEQSYRHNPWRGWMCSCEVLRFEVLRSRSNSVTNSVFIGDFYRLANRHLMAKVIFQSARVAVIPGSCSPRTKCFGGRRLHRGFESWRANRGVRGSPVCVPHSRCKCRP